MPSKLVMLSLAAIALILGDQILHTLRLGADDPW
jgi:hypothetical protein